MKTSELLGAQLDWAVAECEGRTGTGWCIWSDGAYNNVSTNWAQGGPIIERERIDVTTDPFGAWRANVPTDVDWYVGPTPLVAAMRAYVASKLGDEVEIPEDLK